MNLRKNGPGIVKDDRAQSLTEFAIVIPIVLLFFFAMLQYVAIVQAYQVGNYAAYVAARSYAVHAALSIHETGNDARAVDFATSAAAMALAPIARLMPGETTALGYDLSDFELTGSHAEQLIKGYLVAKNLRLNSSVLGGSISIHTSGNPKQVDVEINYPQPIYVPGLVELWNYIGGQKIFTGLESLREGLEGIPKSYGEYQILREQGKSLAGFDIPDELDEYLSLCPHINIQSKCSMGYAEWGAKESFRPRLPDTETAAEVTDPELEKKAEEMKQLQKDIEEAQKRAQHECEDYDNAHKATLAAQTKVAQTDPGTPAHAVAEQELKDAQALEAQKKVSCNNAKADVITQTDRLEKLMKP